MIVHLAAWRFYLKNSPRREEESSYLVLNNDATVSVTNRIGNKLVGDFAALTFPY